MSKIPQMGKIITFRQAMWLLAFTAATIFCISVLFYLRTEKQNSYEAKIESLEQQLTRQSRINKQLIDNLARAQETRLKTETELAENSARLVAAEEELSSLQEMDWESKYNNARTDNETLIGKIAEMELQYSVDADIQNKNYDLLQISKGFVEEDFIRLEFEHEKLAAEYGQLQQQYTHDAQKWKKINQTLSGDLNRQKSESEKQLQIITGLQSDNNAYKDMLAKLENKEALESEEKISASSVTQKTGGNLTTGDYRSVRLKSLGNAMTNRNSSDRKKILISVIPTIPNGISGNELALLIPGMKSEDILSVIQSANNYITRPLDDNTLSALSKNMNEKDVDEATKLLTIE